MATTIMQYFKTFIYERILTNCVTVERFRPIATYTQYNMSLYEVPCTLIECSRLVKIHNVRAQHVGNHFASLMKVDLRVASLKLIVAILSNLACCIKKRKI